MYRQIAAGPHYIQLGADVEIEGVELNEEQAAKVKAYFDEQTAGLKGKVDKLLAEKKAAAAKAEEAERKAQDEAAKAAKAAGDLGEYEKHLKAKHEKELEQYKEQLSQRDSMILGGKKDAAIAELAGQFVSADAAKLMLGQLIDAEYVDGSVAMRFKGTDGGVVATDTKGFMEYLRNSKEFAPVLKGVDSAGGGAAGKGASGGAGAPNDRAAKVASINAKFGKQ